MKASDLFLRCLEAEGVKTIYGVPGEENADVLISLLDSPIEFVTCRHEQTASFMADMQGRLTGNPGVCMSTLGPGATNLITGVANANMDNVPLVAIVGQASTNRLHKESHQNMDAVAMYKPVTKWATSIREVDVIPEVIYKAFKLAKIGKPGAVMIELPENIAKQEVDLSVITKERIEFEYGVSSQDVEYALSLIATCKKPILLVGPGCVREECDSELLQLMDQTNIYAAVTFMGKGAVSARHPHSLHCVGLGMRDIAIEAYSQADLVICIGYSMVEWHPDHWNVGVEKKIIHIDVAAAEVDRNYIPDVELIGSITSTLKSLNLHLNSQHIKDPTLFASIRERIHKDIEEHSTDNHFPVKPQRILHDLRSALRDDDILISDVGAHKMWVARQFPAYHSKTCFIYNGFCSMGGSMPGAVVAKSMYPEKHVVALGGDGSYVMSIQALVTAVELKVPIIVVIWEDDFYGLIKWKQEMEYHEISNVKLINPDLAEVAKSLGCHGVKIKSTDEFLVTLKQAFNEKVKPTVIIVPIDYSENMKLTEHLGEIVAH